MFKIGNKARLRLTGIAAHMFTGDEPQGQATDIVATRFKGIFSRIPLTFFPSCSKSASGLRPGPVGIQLWQAPLQAQGEVKLVAGCRRGVRLRHKPR